MKNSRSGLGRPREWRDFYKCHKCSFKSTLTFRMASHVMTHNFPKRQRLFSCANPIEPLNRSQCLNFQIHKLPDLKHNFKAGHTLKELLYECGNCTLQTYSHFIYLRHKLLNMCLTNKKVKSEGAVLEGWNKFQIVDGKVTKTRDSFGLKRLSKSRHLSGDTDQRSKYKFCDFESEDTQILFDHIKLCQRLDHDLDNFQCDNCSYKTSSKSLLDDHLSKGHKSGKNKYRKCEHCPYIAKQACEVKRHMLWKHTDPEKIKWFQCANCSFKTKTRHNLKEHIMVKHTDADGIRWFRCEDCSFKSKWKSNLKTHIVAKHTYVDGIQWSALLR